MHTYFATVFYNFNRNNVVASSRTDSITQEIYSDYNCTHKETTYYFQPVGCSNNVVYNCTQDEFIPIPAGESFVVQTYYASSYDTANCTGPVQFFLGQENDHCFSTTGGGSQYNDYPVLRQYTGTTTCSGDNFVTNDVVTTCTPDESNTEDGISYTHFNNTLMGNKLFVLVVFRETETLIN